MNSRLLSQWHLSNYAAFRFINCDLIGFICDDHAIAATLNCQGTAAGIPFISGTTDAQQVAFNTSLRTQRGREAPMVQQSEADHPSQVRPASKKCRTSHNEAHSFGWLFDQQQLEARPVGLRLLPWVRNNLDCRRAAWAEMLRLRTRS